MPDAVKVTIDENGDIIDRATDRELRIIALGHACAHHRGTVTTDAAIVTTAEALLKFLTGAA